MSTELEAPVTEAPQETIVQTEATAPEGQEEQKQEPVQEAETVESIRKKAENRINRLEKSRAKKDWQLQETNKQLAELSRKVQEFEAKQNTPKEPSEDDFDNYGDYLKAVARHKPQGQPTEAVDPKKIHEQAFQEAQQQFYIKQRTDFVDTQIDAAKKDIPDFERLEAENEDILAELPQPILMAFLEADNAPMAFYALAKEGKLESLANMTPTRAAMEIASAQIRGEQMAKASKVSKAPTPIQGAKGNSSSTSEDSMSGKELLKKHGLL